jgi:hypothetical protein
MLVQQHGHPHVLLLQVGATGGEGVCAARGRRRGRGLGVGARESAAGAETSQRPAAGAVVQQRMA